MNNNNGNKIRLGQSSDSTVLFAQNMHYYFQNNKLRV